MTEVVYVVTVPGPVPSGLARLVIDAHFQAVKAQQLTRK